MRIPSLYPPWRQPRGKWMGFFLVNFHTNATSKRHLWEIDLRFALNSTPGRPRWPYSRRAEKGVSCKTWVVRTMPRFVGVPS